MVTPKDIRCLAPVGAMLGEGPLWDPRIERLLFVDIKRDTLFRYNPGDGNLEKFNVPGTVSALGLAQSGNYICAMRDGFAALEIEGKEVVTKPICNPEQAMTGNRFNDGKVDPAGGFWAGTMDDDEQTVSGSFWRLAPDRTCSHIDKNIMVTNGPAFDPDKSRVYFADSARQKIFVAHFEDGNVSDKRLFRDFGDGDGYPDGMEVDRNGDLWVAFWDGHAIRRFSCDGEQLSEVKMPVPRPTSVAFVEDKIYVTSARTGLDQTMLEQHPLAGGLFEVKLQQSIAPDVPYYFGQLPVHF